MQIENNSIFPPADNFAEFYTSISPAGRKQFYNAKCRFKKSTSEFNTPQEFLDKGIKNNSGSGIIAIFLIFTSKFKMNVNVRDLEFCYAERILNYLQIVDNNFWQVFDKVFNHQRLGRSRFASELIRALIFLNKKKFDDIVYEDLIKLYDPKYYNRNAKFIAIPTVIERILDNNNKVAKPYRMKKTLSKCYDYGDISKEITEIVDRYLNIKYKYVGQKIDSPLYSIRSFLNWMILKYPEVKLIGDITSKMWCEYKRFIQNREVRDRTKQVQTDLNAMFFEWLYDNGLIYNQVVEYGERYKGYIEVKSRMFKTREHYQQVILDILNYVPGNEYDDIAKQYLLVVSSTGLRLSEAKWLAPGCLTEERDGVGELLVETMDKTLIINKKTSVLPWGVDAIKLLEQRFEKIENKIMLYNENLNKEMFSLFQYNGKLITNDKIYRVYNEILKNIKFIDDQGREINYRNIKLHALRHQKFNDINDVTGGNILAVKLDSGHISTEMARQYTKQDEEKKRILEIKSIKEGRIIGKSVDILNELIRSSIPEHKYLETVKNIQLYSTLKLDNNKNIVKYLGYGFCFGKCQNIKSFCESCDYFFTCKEFESELRERYARTFMLVRSRINVANEAIRIAKGDEELIESLKYQEKWLVELGVSREEIHEIRCKYFI